MLSIVSRTSTPVSFSSRNICVRLAQLLSLHFTLEKGGRFNFFHNPTVYAFLLARGGYSQEDTFPEHCRFITPESGRTLYEKGSPYHIGLCLLPNGARNAAEWLSGLKDTRGTLNAEPLGHHTILRKVLDGVTGREAQNPLDAGWLTLEHVDTVAAQVVDMKQIEIYFDSPVLIPRTPARKAFLDDKVFRLDSLWGKIRTTMEKWFPLLAPSEPIIGTSLIENRMVRAVSRTTKKPYFGSTGSVRVAFEKPLPFAWARALLLSGLVGVGRSTNMGQGRFSIASAALSSYWPPRPGHTHTERAALPKNLAMAREELADAGQTPGVDGVALDEYIEALTYRLPNLQERLAHGDHRPSPLRGILVRKTDGGLRPLTIPTVEDRFLQRACLQTLSPAIDELLEESSFAYRHGLSRRNAESRVSRAHDEGYKYVLEADLRNFFDTVDWHLLEGRLRAYLGRNDPIVPLLMSWVRAPVRFAEHLLERKRGLPQGAVVSPILANLYLDPFDEAIEAKGFRLVRYADDFVVLCKSPQEVERARREVEKQLDGLRLALSEDKTRATSFRDGFLFLGYLFCRSSVIEPRRKAELRKKPLSEADIISELNADDVSGWLAALQGELRDAETPEPSAKFRNPIARTTPARRPLYVVSFGTRITGAHRGLRIYDGDSLRNEVAWDAISEIIILGNRHIGPSVFQRALCNRIPVSLYSRTGKPFGIALPHRVRMPAELTRIHWAYQQKTDNRVRIAASLVESKLHNLRLLMRYQSGDNEQARETLRELGQAALRVETLERLRGIEGHAAFIYFRRFSEWVPTEFGFSVRTGRNALDPINAILNLLYTMLYRLCWVSAITEGLDPHLGTLHADSHRYAPLAADFQEPFRFLCDRLVLDLIHRERLRPEDFERNRKDGPLVKLRPEALKLTIQTWEKRLEAKVKAGTETKTYRGHIEAQARRFGELVRGERTTLDPFRLTW